MKNKKKKTRLDKQSAASIVLSFTMMFFLITMFMASKTVEVSFAVRETATASIPQTLNFSGTSFSGTGAHWNYGGTNLSLMFDFKATDPSTNVQYDMYCIEGDKGIYISDVYNKPTLMNPSYSTGMAWLLSHSYPNETNNEYMNACGNEGNNCKKYITQYAVWLYLNEYTNNRQLTAEQLEALNADNSITKAIKKLAADAKAHNNAEATSISIDTSKIEFTVDGDYMISNEISVSTNKDEYLKQYSVEGLGGATANGVAIVPKIVDVNGNEASALTFQKGSTFRVKVAIADFKEYVGTDTSVIIDIAVTGIFNDGVYEYQSSTGSQRPIISTLTSTAVPQHIALSFTEITKSDITNGKPVEGATLVVKDKDGNEVATWVTDGNPHYVSLKQGDYILCETTSPEGYELNTECVPFTVKDDGTITKVEMKNTPTTPTPDTASNIPIYLYIVGTMILIIGAVVIYYTVKPSKKK